MVGSKKQILKEKPTNIPLGIIYFNKKISLLEKDYKNKGFKFSWSEDGVNFTQDKKKVYLSNGSVNHKPAECSNFRFSYIGKKIYVSYTRIVKEKKTRVISTSKNIYDWEAVSETPSEGFESVLVAYPKANKTQVVYENGTFVKCYTSKDWKKWNDNKSVLFTNRYDHFDKVSIKLIGSYLSDKGITVFYESKESNKDSTYNTYIGVVIFDKDNPYKIVWRSPDPIWKSELAFSRNNVCEVLGMIVKKDTLYFFLNVNNVIITVTLAEDDISIKIPIKSDGTLVKHPKNPIISPHPENKWEDQAVFNPAILKDDDGYIHLIYRAIGSDGVSRLGYDFSKNGTHFVGRLPDPIFSMGNPNDDKKIIKTYDPNMYPSGGSWGGCEDPRAVRIDGRIYLTFNAFDGWDFIRIALISIDEKDFFKKKWKWNKPMLISPPNQINKNWVLFPEKIDGKFAILHSVSPKVQIDFINDFRDVEKGKHVIKSTFKQDPTKKGWDTWVRGIGPPPLKTDKGWLVLYHAMDHRDPNKYKLGALLLDYKNPEKVLARSQEPVLEPEIWYENDWKPGVVYSCGAIIKDRNLYVYYGGGDKYVCVATAPLDKIFNKLK